MRLDLSDSQRAFRDQVREYATKELAPFARQREADKEIDPDTIRELGQRGLLGVNVPKSLGGLEAGVVAYAAALREVGYADASVAVTMAVSNMVAEVITQFGSVEQREKHVPRITSGEYFGGAFALSEPGAGSDAGAIQTRAERKGDTWILNGEKTWISTGDQAGVTVVWTRTSPAPGAAGITCFLVEAGTPGVSFGKPEVKMGLRASHTVSVSFQDVELPASAMIGGENQGFKLAMMALDGGRIGVAAQSTGIGGAALDMARASAEDRKRGGKLIAEHQGIQFKLADVATNLEAGWLLTLRAAWLKETRAQFSRQAAMAKMYASEAANRAVREAVQVCGAYGYLEESEVARLYRDCRVTQIYEGTSEVQRLVIGRDLLRSGVMV